MEVEPAISEFSPFSRTTFQDGGVGGRGAPEFSFTPANSTLVTVRSLLAVSPVVETEAALFHMQDKQARRNTKWS